MSLDLLIRSPAYGNVLRFHALRASQTHSVTGSNRATLWSLSPNVKKLQACMGLATTTTVLVLSGAVLVIVIATPSLDAARLARTPSITHGFVAIDFEYDYEHEYDDGRCTGECQVSEERPSGF